MAGSSALTGRSPGSAALPKEWALAALVVLLHVFAPRTGSPPWDSPPAWSAGLVLVMAVGQGVGVVLARWRPVPASVVVLACYAGQSLVAGVVPPFAAWVLIWSLVFVRPTTDAALKVLHQRDAFEAGCRAVPGLAAWTDADRAVPTSDVLVGGALRNVYRPQPRIAGIVAVGDAVTTTTPTAGRGVAMACLQVQALVDLVDDGAGPEDIGETFDGWCETNMRPWVRDHVACDTEAVRLWQGGDIDLAAPLTSTRIIEAAQVDSRIAGHVGGYLTMTALPESLGAAERLASAVYATGWRAPWTEGPSRDELLTVVEGVSAA